MPKLWVFKGHTGNTRAITDDRTGAKLPNRRGGWVYEKEVTIEPGGAALVGADGDRVLANIAKDGFHIWPEEKAS